MITNADQELVRVGEIINYLKELRRIFFEILDIGMGEDEGEECVFSAVVGLRQVSVDGCE